jgi:hypothetical protein
VPTTEVGVAGSTASQGGVVSSGDLCVGGAPSCGNGPSAHSLAERPS